MQRQFRWMLSSLMSVVLLGAGATVFAARSYAPNGLLSAKQNPAAGLPPMTKWVYYGTKYTSEIVFVFGTTSEAFPLNAYPPKDAHSQWTGWDNPSAIIWYYQHVSKTDFGNSVFGNGVKYSTRLIEVMKQEHFAPAMVGGVNPPNWNVVVVPKTKVAPVPPPPKQNPNEYPAGTIVLNWRWAPSEKIGTTDIPAKANQGVLVYQNAEPPTGVVSTEYPTVDAKWVQFPKPWTRTDSVAILQAIAQQSPSQWKTLREIVAPKGIGIQYSADLAAAMTIQHFNPGSLGMQPLAPSAQALTPATETWLIKNGWGGVLAQYATTHHLSAPHGTKNASKVKHSS